MDHSSLTMKDDTTNHKRWHLWNSPLYPIVHQELVHLMKIEGLGSCSLPSFLKRNSNQDGNSPSVTGNEQHDKEPVKNYCTYKHERSIQPSSSDN